MAYLSSPLQAATASSVSVPTIYISQPVSFSINWDQLDNELRRMLAPVSVSLNNDTITTTEAAEAFTSVLREHLTYNNVLRDRVKGPHRERQIVKTAKSLSQKKNSLRRNIRRSHGEFLNAVRTHNAVIRSQREFQQRQTTR